MELQNLDFDHLQQLNQQLNNLAAREEEPA